MDPVKTPPFRLFEGLFQYHLPIYVCVFDVGAEIETEIARAICFYSETMRSLRFVGGNAV
jgi:hypothetical protein